MKCLHPWNGITRSAGITMITIRHNKQSYIFEIDLVLSGEGSLDGMAKIYIFLKSKANIILLHQRPEMDTMEGTIPKEGVLAKT